MRPVRPKTVTGYLPIAVLPACEDSGSPGVRRSGTDTPYQPRSCQNRRRIGIRRRLGAASNHLKPPTMSDRLVAPTEESAGNGPSRCDPSRLSTLSTRFIEPVVEPTGTHVVSIPSAHETLDKNGSSWRIQIESQYR